MKLSVADRLVILDSISMMEGTFIGVAMNRDIRKKIEFSQEERDAAKMRTVVSEKDGTQNIYFDDKVEIPKDVEFTSSELEHLATMVNKIEQTGGIKEQNYDILKALRSADQEKAKK